MVMDAILLIEPDEEVGSLYATIFDEGNWKVSVVHSLAEAAAALARSRFDLIITEALDQTDKFSFDPAYLAQLKELAGGTPVILCSTYVATCVVHGGDFGLAGVVRKPFELENLWDEVKKLLEASKAAHKGDSGDLSSALFF